jgi:hypothetical protein
MSYLGSLDVGINIDEAAVESPSLLRESLQSAFEEMSSYAPARVGLSEDGAASEPQKISRRWWRRSR